MNEPAIGGFFGLETDRRNVDPWMQDARRFVSGRAALAAFLATRSEGTIWLPHYVCAAVDEALVGAAQRCRRYALGPDFGPPADLPVCPGETLIVVDYFGCASASVKRAVARHGRGQVLVDASQSLFFPRDAADHFVFSPRKFAGLPDGGLLVSPAAAKTSGDPDEAGSVARAQHLLMRSAGLREEGRPVFQQAEASLTFRHSEPMSSLTSSMLDSIDFRTIAAVRRANAAILQSLLPSPHPIFAESDPEVAPLCVPVLSRDPAAVRRQLAAHRVFLAHYWPDVDVPVEDVFARILSERTVFLPCDQRYDANDMRRIASLLDQVESSL